MEPEGESAVLVPVPEAERLVGEHRLRLDPSAAAGVPAHVTLLFPFLPPAEIDGEVASRLRALCRGFAPRTVSFSDVGRFPDVVWLVPEPGTAFVEMMRAVWEQWPQCAPYGGAIPRDSVVPHLTVGHAGGPAAVRLEGVLRHELPIVSRLEEVWLMTSERGLWTRHTAFPVGTG